MMTSTIFGLVIGSVVTLIVWAVLDLVFSEERRVARRLAALSDIERRQASEVEPLATPFRQRVLRPGGSWMARALRGLLPQGYRERLQRKARMAGNPGGLDADSMIALKVLAFAVSLTLGGLLGLLGWGLSATAFVFALVLAVLGGLLPDVWLSSRVSRRKDSIRRELPDMLDMLMIAVEAGLGFDAAVSKYVRNRTGPLAEELGVELSEVQAGLTRREALRNLAERCDVFELSTFCMAMVQADIFGVSVGKVLRTQSREIRVKRRQHAEEVAQKAPAKMVFPLVLCILPATLIVLMTPAVISIARAFGAM